MIPEIFDEGIRVATVCAGIPKASTPVGKTDVHRIVNQIEDERVQQRGVYRPVHTQFGTCLSMKQVVSPGHPGPRPSSAMNIDTGASVLSARRPDPRAGMLEGNIRDKHGASLSSRTCISAVPLASASQPSSSEPRFL
jgi:hypothetical protein